MASFILASNDYGQELYQKLNEKAKEQNIPVITFKRNILCDIFNIPKDYDSNTIYHLLYEVLHERGVEQNISKKQIVRNCFRGYFGMPMPRAKLQYTKIGGLLQQREKRFQILEFLIKVESATMQKIADQLKTTKKSIGESLNFNSHYFEFFSIPYDRQRSWKALCEIKKRAKTEEEAEAVKVRCIRKQLGSELAEKEAIIEFNRQRKKNYEQIYHEVKLLEEIYAEQAKLRMRLGKTLDPSADPQQGMGEPGKTKEKLAAATGMKETQLRLLMRIGDRCTTEKKKENQKLYENAKNIMKELRAGEISIDAADKKLAVLDAELDEELPDWKREKLADLAKEVRDQKISPNQASEKLKKIKTANEAPKKETKIELPEGVFDVMVADPQDINDARELKIDAIDAACFLWANKKNITERIELLKHWGFDLKEIAVWEDHSRIGGPWFFGIVELLLLGIKGSMAPPKLGAAKGEGEIANLFFDRDLTRDPDVTYTHAVHKSIVVYEMAEQMFPGRTYCDPFSRNGRANWLQPIIVEELAQQPCSEPCIQPETSS